MIFHIIYGIEYVITLEYISKFNLLVHVVPHNINIE